MGWMKLFPSITLTIAAIAISLELAKLAVASVAIHYKHISAKRFTLDAMTIKKTILLKGLLLLIVMSIIGHYGFLAASYYHDKTDITVATELHKDTKERKAYVISEINRLNHLYQDLPPNQPTKKMQIYNQVQPEIKQLNEELKQLNEEQKTQTSSKANTEIKDKNNLKYMAEAIGTTEDGAARIVIALFAILIDPIAITMLAFGVSMKRGNLELPKPTAINIQEELKATDNPVGINLMNVRDYDINGVKVDDILRMSNNEIKLFASKMDTVTKREWLKHALIYRQAYKDGLTIDLDSLSQYNGNEILESITGKSA